MRYICIFSGISAPSVAWKSLSWRPIAFAEKDKFCSTVLAFHFPQVPNLGDVLQVDWSKFKNQAEVLVGGSPCQDFSVVGKRRSLVGNRGQLSLKFAEIWHGIEAPFSIFENVPGILSAEGNAFGALLSKMVGATKPLQPGRAKRWGDAGLVIGEKASVAWRVLDSQFFGLPQRRRRVFIVGFHFGGGSRFFGTSSRIIQDRLGALPAAVLFESESLHRNSSSSSQKGEEAATSIRSRTAEELLGFSFKDSGGDAALGIAPTLRSLNFQDSWANSGSHLAIAYRSEEFGQCQNSYGLRRLTPVECERLQGLPPNYLNIPYNGKPPADGHRYRACGNAMSVPVIKWVGNRLDSLVASCFATNHLG